MGKADIGNNTFGTNNAGIYYERSAGHTLKVVDSLFTDFTAGDISPPAEKEGISLYGPQQGTFLHNFNAFYGLTHNIYDHQAWEEIAIGTGSQELSSSPYGAAEQEGWQLRYRLSQESPVIDAGSSLAIETWPHPENRRTTRADGVCDMGMVDIGFHFYSFEDTDNDGMDDAWEKNWLGDLTQTAGGDYDGDDLTNIHEYQNGVDPTSKDTDGDGYNDPDDGYPLRPEYDKGPYLQNTHYVAEEGSAITVMCETASPPKMLKVRYRVPPGEWEVKYRTNYEEPVSKQRIAYEFELTGLDPNTTYEYEVGYGFWYARGDPPWTFLTAPSGAIPFRFVVYGDNRGDTGQPWGLYGLQQNHQAVVNAILSYSNPVDNPIGFVLHTGDLVRDGGDYEQWKPQFFDPAKDLMKGVAVFECLGNHEYNGDPEGGKYLAFFDLPEGYKPTNGQLVENWYCFDYANCHFIVLDTGTNALASEIGPDTDQYEWLLDDISSDEALNADWVIVLLHIPPYTDGAAGEPHQYDSADISRVRTYLTPVFQDPAHPEDLVFSGHNHLYERSQSTDEQQPGYWVHYIVTGGGGAPTHTPGDGNPKRVPGKAKESLHHCVIDIDGTTATLNVVRNNGSLMEQNVILTPGQQWP